MLDLGIDKKLLLLLNDYNSWIYDALDGTSISSIRMFLLAHDAEEKLTCAFEMVLSLTDFVEPEHHFFKDLCCSVYPDLHNFERAASFTNPDYRSHLVHSCYVFLLGLFIITNYGKEGLFFDNLNLGYFDNQFVFQQKNVYPYGNVNERDVFIRRWILTSIFHDVAYQTENEYKSINTKSETITGSKYLYRLNVDNLDDLLFIPEASKLRKKLNVLPEMKLRTFADDALDIVSKRLAQRLDNHNACTIYNSYKNTILTSIASYNWDHGLMGSIYLIRSFMTSLSKFPLEDCPENILTAYQLYDIFLDFTDAVAGMSLHNIKFFKAGIFNNNKPKLQISRLPLAVLLIITDEMQFWNRNLKSYPNLMKKVTLSKNGAHTYNHLVLIREAWTQLCFDLINNPESVISDQRGKKLSIKVPFFLSSVSKKEKEEKGVVKLNDFKFINTLHWLKEDPLEYKISDETLKKEWKTFVKQHGSLGVILDVCLALCKLTCDLDDNRKLKLPFDVEKYKFIKDHFSKLEDIKKIGREQLLPFGSGSFYDIHSVRITDNASGRSKITDDNQPNSALYLSVEAEVLKKVSEAISTLIDNEDLKRVLSLEILDTIDHKNGGIDKAIGKLRTKIIRMFRKKDLVKI